MKSKFAFPQFPAIKSTHIYIIGLTCCLLVHIVFLIFFAKFEIKEMTIINICSVVIYLVLTFMIKRVKNTTPLIIIAIFEIVLHAIAATVYVGWSFGFALFIVCITPIPFFLEFSKDIFSYIIPPILTLFFIGLKIYTYHDNHVVYNFENEQITLAFYVFNSFLSFAMIICISAIYKISKQKSQIQLKLKNENLTKLATIDPLTQLFNRRAMTEFFKRIHDTALVTKKNYIVAWGDIDNFGMVNDSHGHSCGDTVLKKVSNIFTENVPAEGYVSRWGGEELLFVVPNTQLEEGVLIANQICKKISEQKFKGKDGEIFSVTITFGVCECSSQMHYEEALNIADKYLYKGKSLGKNCVISKLDNISII